MALTIVGGVSAPKIIWDGGTYTCPVPQKSIVHFKEEMLKHELIDGAVKKHIKGYYFSGSFEWECINEEDTDDLKEFIQILNYMKNADNRTIQFYPHSDNDFYTNVYVDADIDLLRGISEMDKLSGHSLKLKFEGSELLNALPFGWISPTGYEDPDTAWTDEADAYDESTDSGAYSLVSASSWSSYIHLTFPAILANKLRFWITGSAGHTQVDVDIYAGAWYDVYQGSFSILQWIEKNFTARSNITKMRLRIYNNGGSPSTAYLREIDIGIF